MAKQLVLAGGGHAHMVTLAKLEEFVNKGIAVTVIGPSTHHYYSGMGPGMLGNTYTPQDIRFATRHLVEKNGGKFVLGKVVRIDADQQRVVLDTGASVEYDVLSCNLGSHVPQSLISGGLDDIYMVKPIERLLEARDRILSLAGQKKVAVGIVGGGPSAVEIAGNAWRLTQGNNVMPADITIFAGSMIMPHHAPGVRDRAMASLQKRGIRILTDCRVKTIQTGQVIDASGAAHAFDVIFAALGVQPNAVFKQSNLPTGPDGGLLVNPYLQSPAYPNIFGGGDCIYFEPSPLNKVGVYAVRQNPVIFDNLMAALTGGQLRAFEPGGDYLLIFNMGDGTGIFHKRKLLFGGRPAFWIKDYIDRKFMREFQAFEK